MNRRLAKIIFSHKNDLSATTLIQLLGQLPKDAKIINMGEDWTKHCYGVTVESERYKQVSECQEIPEIIAKFERKDFNDPNKITCSLDDSAVLDSDHHSYRSAEKQNEIYEAGRLYYSNLNDPKYPPTLPLEPANFFDKYLEGVEKHLIANFATKFTMEDPLITAKFPTTLPLEPANHFDKYLEAVEKHSITIPTGFALKDSIVNVVGGANAKMPLAKKKCNHSWQKYEGIMNSYNFCVHCDAKENL